VVCVTSLKTPDSWSRKTGVPSFKTQVSRQVSSDVPVKRCAAARLSPSVNQRDVHFSPRVSFLSKVECAVSAQTLCVCVFVYIHKFTSACTHTHTDFQQKNNNKAMHDLKSWILHVGYWSATLSGAIR